MSETCFDSLLESFSGDSSEAPTGGSPGPLKRGISYAHEQMIDLVIANPGISQGEIARQMGYSESWISQIFNSDAFQSRLAERREALVDPSIRKQIDEGFDALIKRSLEVLKAKVALPPTMVSDQLAIRTLEVAARARGYGAKVDEQRTPAVNVEVHLQQIGGGLVDLLRRKKTEAIEHSATAGPPDRGLASTQSILESSHESPQSA